MKDAVCVGRKDVVASIGGCQWLVSAVHVMRRVWRDVRSVFFFFFMYIHLNTGTVF